MPMSNNSRKGNRTANSTAATARRLGFDFASRMIHVSGPAKEPATRNVEWEGVASRIAGIFGKGWATYAPCVVDTLGITGADSHCRSTKHGLATFVWSGDRRISILPLHGLLSPLRVQSPKGS